MRARKNKELKDTIAYLKERLLREGSDEKVVKKALGLDYPNDCPDMVPIEGDFTRRECACKASERPVEVHRDKKIGKFIVLFWHQ